MKTFEPSSMNKCYFYDSVMGSAAVKVLLLGWPHNIFQAVHRIFRDDLFGSFISRSALTAAEI